MNDIILNMLANDSFSVSDFKAVGLTAVNTKLESEETYKKSKTIQEHQLFKDNNGNFNDDLFHQYYLQATDFYNKLADDTYLEDITKNTFYSKHNLFAPEGSPKIDEAPTFIVSANPFLLNNSLTRVGKRGDRDLSISEIAQTQKIYDSESKTFRDESVNDRAFGNNPIKWLGDLFSEPLVIAQWDADGEHEDPLTGETKQHKKGDYKYNEEGTFYYETLNGRDVYGKQVLNRMNTLTVDGSKANTYDFFDSDDLEQKSIIGSVLKNLALVGSMFLPVVGKPIIAASVASQSMGLLGTLGKMFLGSENKAANNLHAWAKTVNRHSSTEYASQNTWCWENMLNMIGDVVGQLSEQRFLFTHVPALFKGTKGIKARDTKTYDELVKARTAEIKEATGKDLNKVIETLKKGVVAGSDDALRELQELGIQHTTISQLKAAAELEKYMAAYNKLGSVMSKAYMTGITVQDTYGEAKANGASDMEALALTLGYAAGEAWILNTGLGEWIMPELHGDKLKYRSIVNALKNDVKNLTKNIDQATTTEAKQNIFKKIFNIGKKVATDDYAKNLFTSKTINPMKVIFAHAAGEAFEELSEEVLADVSKSAFNTVNWLRGDETRIAGAWENVIDRYGMSLLGGFIGGGLSSAGTDFKYALKLGQMNSESAIQEIVYMVNNDKIDDFLKYVNKADLGSKYLSSELDENGNHKPGTPENNIDKEIKTILNHQVLLIKDTINAEGAKFSENSLFDALTLKDLRYLLLRNTRTASLMFLEYNTIVSDMFKEHQKIRELTGVATNTDTKKKELTETEQLELKQAQERLKTLRLRKEAILNGKRAPEFIAAALYEASPVLQAHGNGYTYLGFVESQTDKKWEDLTETEKQHYVELYKVYRDTEMKNDIMGSTKQFINLVGYATPAIQEQQEYIKKLLNASKNTSLQIQTFLGNILQSINTLVETPDLDLDTFIEQTQKTINSVNPGIIKKLSKDYYNDDIKKRLKYIEQKEIDAGYTQEVKNLDKATTLLEGFVLYIDTITQNFIDTGYIHPEVKNQLINAYQYAINNLKQFKSYEMLASLPIQLLLSVNLGKSVDDIVDYYEGELIRENEFNTYIQSVENNIEELKKLTHTPIIDLIEKFKISASNLDLSVKEVVDKVTTLVNEKSEDISDIVYGVELGSQLQEVEELIDVLASVLYGTRVDRSSVNNAWGYSKTLNELNKKYGNDLWVELAEIEGETANLLQQDLALLKLKITYVKNLNKVNSGQKLAQLAKVGYNKHYIFFNKFKRLVNYVPEELSNWDFSSILEALKSVVILEKYNSEHALERRLHLSPEEKIAIEREALMIDDAIYEFFEDNASKMLNIDELSKLINAKNFNLFDPANKLLTDQVDDLDDGQFIFSLAARAAVKSSAFHNYLRKTYNEEKAPVPMLEQAVYLNVAMVMNGDVINNFAKAYTKSTFEAFKNYSKEQRKEVLERLGYTDGQIQLYVNDPDSFIIDSAVEKFANIILTEGIAGSGKTEGVFDSTIKVLKLINPELLKNAFIVNATLKNAESLAELLQIEGKAFSSSNKETKHDLIRYFYSDFTDDYKSRITYVNNELKLNFTLNKDLKDVPKVIFIDESSRYDYVKMQLLSEAAQHYGIAVLTAGDFDQISASSSIEMGSGKDKITIQFAPDRLNFIRSPKLGLSFRTLNSQMVANQKEVLSKLHMEDVHHLTMHYWEDEKEIRGFKVYLDSEFDAIVESINKIKQSLKQGEKIGYLYSDEDRSLKDKLKEKFGDLLEDKSITDAQGLEGDYYIIDFNSFGTTKTQLELKQEFYTGFTRARKGGIVINNYKDDFIGLPILNIKDQVSELESITPAQIKKVSLLRKEIFDNIFEHKPDEPIDYHELTKVERQLNVVVDEPDSENEEGIPPPPPAIPAPAEEQIPIGMYKTREEAEQVDLSMYTPGLEVLDESGVVAGTIQETTIYEQIDDNGLTYYAPAVVIQTVDSNIEYWYAQEMMKYTLKDPGTSEPIPKYKVGDVFYDAEGNSIGILEVILGNEIEYRIQDSNGQIQVISELTFGNYTINPPIKTVQQENDPLGGSDNGENDPNEIYQRRILNQNGSKRKQVIESDGTITHWMYTFNAYETGVLWDEQGHIRAEHFEEGHPINQRTEARIDNANGLLKLNIIKPTIEKDACVSILANIHSELMSNPDNADILQVLTTTFDLPPGTLSTIEYGLKSSAGINSTSNKIYGTKDEDTKWHVMDKHKDEKSEFSPNGVLEGDAISRKTVVAVFRNEEGEKVLEITVGVLNSPLTIGQTTNLDGTYVYPEIGLLLETLTPESETKDVFAVCTLAIEICKNNNWIDLGNLFKAFLFTSNGYAPLHRKGEQFNLAQQKHEGPNIIKEKGSYQRNATRKYKSEPMDLHDYIEDPRKVVSDIYIPKTNVVGLNTHAHIHPGHAGVFVTFNQTHDRALLADKYLEQINPNYTGKKDIEFRYIIPPSATVAEYTKNIRNALLNTIYGGVRPVHPIGNMWTAYHILKNVYLGGALHEGEGGLKSSVLNHIELSVITNLLDKLIAIENIQNWEGDRDYDALYNDYMNLYNNKDIAKTFAIRNAIIQKQDLILRLNIGNPATPVYKLFSKYIAAAVYWDLKETTLPSLEALAILEKYYPESIKYKSLYADESTGIFVKAKVSATDKYSLQGIDADGEDVLKRYQINGKEDPPIFEIPNLTTAVAILAQWEYKDENDTNKGKEIIGDLRNGTYGYLNNGKNVNKSENNFEKLKNNNKILFESGGLFADIQVRGEDDPAYNQIHFAELILTQFNSIPNLVGFAVVNSDGSVKLHGFKINDLPEINRKPEMETNLSLGGITIGKPLIFTTPDTSLNFTSANRNYYITLDGNKLVFNYDIVKEEVVRNELIQVTTGNNSLTKELWDHFVDIIQNDKDVTPFLKDAVELTNYEDFIQDDYMKQDLRMELLDAALMDLDEIMWQYLIGGGNEGSLNVSVGDRVSTDIGLVVIAGKIKKIDGNVITLDNDLEYNVSTEKLYKVLETQSISCNTPISIAYGE